MEPCTYHEREIARIVDQLAVNGTLNKSSVSDVANLVRFAMKPEEMKFLLAYLIWRRQNPAARAESASLFRLQSLLHSA